MICNRIAVVTGIRDIAWQVEADVVVVGSGATGLPAAIVAREAGASVIVVEAEPDIGGHAITSGGNVPLGGGNSAQRAHGIEDSPDLMFRDLTDWSVVEPNGFPDYRYNDHEIVRAFCDHAAATHDFLVTTAWCSSARRRMHAAATPSATRCRARCIVPRWTGQWCRPASRSIHRCARRHRPATA
jgi:succinate dehydrogenase/fumarate reductase flavoprotein subunit